LERLPRPSGDAGVYLYEFNNRIFAHSRGGKDSHRYFWDESQNAWKIDDVTPALSVQLGGSALSAALGEVTYKGRAAFTASPEDGKIAEWYYANGFLIFRLVGPDKKPPTNLLTAVRWSSESGNAVKLSPRNAFRLRTPGEFVYAFGQLKDQVVAATNTGGVYSFNGKDWKVWREPNGVSFQIYSMINFENRLLMGQYPTGMLFEFDGSRFELLPKHPPVRPGVSANAREAQTLAVYGGDLYAGVWPWGEVWRFDRNHRDWRLAGRVFTHPKPTDATTHPYEKETTALDPVLNLWGQRVTSLVPHGDSLWIATSAKSSDPYDPKFTFLDGDKWQEYGAVYRYRQPGNLATPIEWKDEPTRFEFVFTSDRVAISQDGKQLGQVPLEPGAAARIAKSRIATAKGIYGELGGKLIESSAK
jgi:hypothetical protein